MGTVGWLLVIAVGIALGFTIGRLWPGQAARITELERERDEAREDLRGYRQDVSMHFERTAQLFDKVTHDYRNLYEHLALSARQLSAIPGESSEARLAEPERRQLGPVQPVQPSPDEDQLAAPADFAADNAEPEPAADADAEAEAEAESERRPEPELGSEDESGLEPEDAEPPLEAAEPTDRKQPDELR